MAFVAGSSRGPRLIWGYVRSVATYCYEGTDETQDKPMGGRRTPLLLCQRGCSQLAADLDVDVGAAGLSKSELIVVGNGWIMSCFVIHFLRSGHRLNQICVWRLSGVFSCFVTTSFLNIVFEPRPNRCPVKIWWFYVDGQGGLGDLTLPEGSSSGQVGQRGVRTCLRSCPCQGGHDIYEYLVNTYVFFVYRTYVALMARTPISPLRVVVLKKAAFI